MQKQDHHGQPIGRMPDRAGVAHHPERRPDPAAARRRVRPPQLDNERGRVGSDERAESELDDSDGSLLSLVGACALLAFLVLGVATGWFSVAAAAIVEVFR